MLKQIEEEEEGQKFYSKIDEKLDLIYFIFVIFYVLPLYGV